MMNVPNQLDNCRPNGTVGGLVMPDGQKYSGPVWRRIDGYCFVLYQNKPVRVICPRDDWEVTTAPIPKLGESIPC